MKKLVVVVTIVAVVAITVTAAAGSSNRRVFCGNFSGQGQSPHVAYKPNGCDVTPIGRHSKVKKLRKMHWSRWDGIAKGKGKVNGEKRAVRLRKGRPCGQNGEFDVYSQMRIGDKKWRKILYCGD